jgi:hypothetical protein
VHGAAKFEVNVLPVACIYFDRLQSQKAYPECYTLTEFNVHRLLAISFVLAYKFLMDPPELHDNVTMVRVAGLVNVEELNRMERTALGLIDWRLCVDSAEFDAKATCLGVATIAEQSVPGPLVAVDA